MNTGFVTLRWTVEALTELLRDTGCDYGMPKVLHMPGSVCKLCYIVKLLIVIYIKADIKCNACVYRSMYGMGCVVGWFLMDFSLVGMIFHAIVSESLDIVIQT